MKVKLVFAVCILHGFLLDAHAGIPEMLVQPLNARSHFEWTSLRAPGSMSSNSRWVEFEEPDWVGVGSSQIANGKTYNYETGAYMRTLFFRDSDNQTGNFVCAAGEARTQMVLNDDPGVFTTLSGINHIKMVWRVDIPVRFRLHANLALSDIATPIDGFARAEVGLLIRGGSVDRSITLNSFEQQSASIDWTISLDPGVYRLESWANSFAFSSTENEWIQSVASYDYQGEFMLVPAPPVGVMCLSVLIQLPRRRLATKM